jgi:phosphonate transport system substrate-binding protein
MHRSRPAGLAAALLALALLLSPPAGAAPKTYAVGVVPYFTAEKIFQLYDPFIRYLNENTPYRWELRLGKTHAELVSGLCSGEIAVAFLGPVPFGKALRACAPRPLLISLGPDGQPFYRSVIATADPAISSLAQLRGRRFGVFEMSTASHYLPLKMLDAAGLARRDVDLVPLGSQDRILAALLAHEVAAGGLKESLFERFRGAGLRALQVSEPLPQFVYAASPALPEGAGAGFAAALLKVQPRAREADRALVAHWDPELANGFAAPPAGFAESVLALLASIEPYLK